jgi:uncharacterized protein (DUF934 family)
MGRVLRQREVVVDAWRDAPQGEDGACVPATPIIVPFARWFAEREVWLRRGGPLGVRVAPADPVDRLVDDLARLDLIAIEFGGIGEGRGYSQARALRQRYGYTRELRAVGCVSPDQVVFLARCGFDAFELPEAELEPARAALDRYTVAYQYADERIVRPRVRHARLQT